jgi:hypothetical protein
VTAICHNTPQFPCRSFAGVWCMAGLAAATLLAITAQLIFDVVICLTCGGQISHRTCGVAACLAWQTADTIQTSPKFDFFAGKDVVGAVPYLTAPTNRNYSVTSCPYSFIGEAHNTRGGCDTSRPYKSICRGGLGTTPKSMICRHGCLWAAGKTAPTNPNKSPQQMFTVVVQAKL